MIFRPTKKLLIIVVLAMLAIGGLIYIFLVSRTVNIYGEINDTQLFPHPLSGISCTNHNARPYAVMLAVDAATRPLSGIAAADVVVEMPVVKDSITRLMALYACEQPGLIGSVRSARDDFTPLAAGFDAIYAHWGGSSFALKQLNQGIIDNIDALPNPSEAFFRHGPLPSPHNGFTSYENLSLAADGLGYRTETIFEGYPHAENIPAKDAPESATLSIKYLRPYNVDYIYNKETNRYLRWRGGTPERDALDNRQAEAAAVAVMFTASRAISADYNDVDVTGNGRAVIFQNGEAIEGEWSKDGANVSSKLFFKDANGHEISLTPGSLWLAIVDNGMDIIWQEKII